MLELPIESIIVEEARQRSRVDPIGVHSLSLDIMERGLLHAPVVRQDSDGKYYLVAGMRRLTALSDLHSINWPIQYGVDRILPRGYVPAISLGELDVLSAKETELSENIQREDLPWGERIFAVREIHQLRTQQAEMRGERHTMLETAQEVMPRKLEAYESPTVAKSAAVKEISRALKVAEHYEVEGVAKAKTLVEAEKIVDRHKVLQELSRRATSLRPTLSEGRHQLYLGNAQELFSRLPDNSIDIVICDPPYGIDAQNFNEQFSRKTRFSDDERSMWSLLNSFSSQSERFMKEQSHLYLMCDTRNFSEIADLLEGDGWKVWPWPLIWFKGGKALPWPQHGPRRSYEAILYAIRGSKPIVLIGVNDVIDKCPPINSEIHPHAKPESLYIDLLRRSCKVGDTILDFACGTGPVFVAANKLYLTAIGFESDGAMFAHCSEFLK